MPHRHYPTRIIYRGGRRIFTWAGPYIGDTVVYRYCCARRLSEHVRRRTRSRGRRLGQPYIVRSSRRGVIAYYHAS